MPKDEKMKDGLIFLYKKFYPVILGADVHGYNLARELNKLGKSVYIAHEQDDGFTLSLRRISNLYDALRNIRTVYLRISLKSPFFINSLGVIFKALGKKVVLEFNAPFEELKFEGVSEKKIRLYRLFFKLILRFVDGVIVVSEPLKDYLEQSFSYCNVKVIPNGGEKFGDRGSTNALCDEYYDFSKKFPKKVIWVANIEYIQGVTEVQSLCGMMLEQKAGVIIVDNSADNKLSEVFDYANVFFLRNPSRAEIGQAMHDCSGGIAFYDLSKYEKVGLAFYNSPLKVYEYIANDLYVLSNLCAENIPAHKDKIITLGSDFTNKDLLPFFDSEQKPNGYRSWEDVALETINFLENL